MAAEIKVVAIVVLYSQRLVETATYISLLQNARISYLVYDNSPVPQQVDYDNVTYIHDPSNPGVSKAYNEAIRWAKELSASHLLLLDSDSDFPSNALESYEVAAQSFPDRFILPSLISSGKKISPFYFSLGKARYGEGIEVGELQLGRQLAINSGSLLPMKKLNTNRFNENLPLDWSDVYFFRQIAKTSTKVQHIALTVRHGLSEHETRTSAAARYRFDLHLKGIKEVAETRLEWLFMFFWAKLKALKLCIQYRSPWFMIQYLKRVYE